jgi:hypothetical protein
MRTLDHWKSRLTVIPITIECPLMQLLSGRDGEPPVFTGSGHIDVKSATAIDFTMFAAATDDSTALNQLLRARQNPYQPLDQFRLVATDYEGTEWACGWTQPLLKGVPTVGWPLSGALTCLTTHVSGPLVSEDSGVELVFQPKVVLPMEDKVTSVSSVDSREIERTETSGHHTVTVLDSEIKFFYALTEDSLWVTAKTSHKLRHPYAENWIAEPLRVILGQLIYPRLVARNFGNGTAHISLRLSPRLSVNPAIASLIRGDPQRQGTNFWDLYKRLLKTVADARDEQGNPNFESHKITRFYEEIIQAAQSSRWVQCMTLAGTGEALARMLMRPDEQSSDFPESDIESLKACVAAWPGNKELRSRILGDIAIASKRTVGRYLRDLAKRDVLTDTNVRAWSEVRNAVMHGSLVSPWATEEEDKRLLALAQLVHRLTHELIRGATE